MNSVLILFGHPGLESSRVNKAWVDAVRHLEGVTLHDLYETYPEFDVDPAREQELCDAHDIIVMQHPLYWYSTPAIFKQWFDLVLEHGWAYGKDGDALEGKKLMSAVTTGGKADAYQKGAFHDITIEELLAPIRQTARLCKMEYLPPHVGWGTLTMTEGDVLESAGHYAQVIEGLRDGHPPKGGA